MTSILRPPAARMSLWLFVFIYSLIAQQVQGQSPIPLTTLGSPYTQNFNTLVSTGTADASTLPLGFAFVESGANANTTYTANNGSSQTGDTYSYGTTGSPDRAFGTLRSGSITPTIGAAFINNTGVTVTALAISFVGEQWRLGVQNRVPDSDALIFEYSLNAPDISSASGIWIPVNALRFNTPNPSTGAGQTDGNSSGNRTALSTTITDLSIPNGATFRIRFRDFSVPSFNDGLAIDDFSLTPLVPAPDLTVSVTDSPDPVLIKNQLTYTLTVTNQGTVDASNVNLRFTLPNGVTFNGTTATNGFSATFFGNVITFSGGSINAGTNATLTVRVTPNSAGTLSLPAGAATIDPQNTIAESIETNNGSAENNTLVTAPDLTVTVSDSPDPVTAGTQLAYNLQVSNMGNANASGVVVRFILPDGVVFNSTSTSGNGFTSNQSGDVITFSNGVMNANSATQLTVIVTPSTVGTLNLPANAATIDPQNSIAESNEGNNSSVALTTTVNSAVAASLAGTTNICAGQSANLSAMITGGTAPYSLTYSDGTNTTSVANYTSGASIAVSPTSTTTYTLTKVTDANGNPATISNASATITVNPTPTLTISNPASVCSPTTVDLTAAAVTVGSNLQGGSLSYFTDANGTNTLSNPSDVAVSGTYYIKATTNNSCTAIAPVTATINTPPTVANAGSDQSVTLGNTATLNANTPIIGTGMWSVMSGPSTAAAQFSSVTDPMATFTPAGGIGQYVLTWTISNANCPPSSSNATITVNPAPKPDLTVSVAGPQSAIIGQVFTYSLLVSNTSSVNATGVDAQVILPSGVMVSGISSAGGFVPCQSGSIISFAGGSITGNSSVTLTVRVTANVPGTITLPSGAVQIDLNNTVAESDETNNSSTETVMTTVAAPVVNLSVSTNAASELNPAAITVTATSSAPVVGDQTVDLTISGTGITAGDYSLSSPTIIIPNGQTVGSVTFTVTDDNAVEGTETATLTISNPSTNIAFGTTTSQDIAITDNDIAPSLSISAVSKNEGNSGSTTFTFTVNLTAPAPAGGVTFDIATQDGTATAGTDYTAKSLTGQTILEGSSTYTFDVSVNGDATFEPDETFVVNVDNITGATVSKGQATGTIVNDDPAPQPDLAITLTDSPDPVVAGNTLTYTITLTNDGNADAANTELTFPLPSGVTFTSFTTPSGWVATTPAVNGTGTITVTNAGFGFGTQAVFTLAVTPTTANAALNATATVTTTTSESVTDNNSATTTTTISPANQSPVPAVITDQTAVVAVPFSFTVPAFTDPESESLTYMITGLATGLTVDYATRVINGTPTTTGVSTVTVVATDPQSASASQTFTITVNANQAPVAPSVDNQTATVGTAFSFTVPAFTDAENQLLTYATAGLPSPLTFDPSTRAISGTLTTAGVSSITVTATDPANNVSSTTFSLIVEPAPVTALTLVASANPTSLLTTETTALSATVSGGTAPYSYTFAGPGVISPNENTASVSGLLAGVQTFTVTVADGTSPTAQTVSATLSVTVTAANQAPTVANVIPNQTATASQPFNFAIPANTFTDDAGVVSIVVAGLPTGLSFDGSTTAISGIPATDGVSSVTVTATDAGNLSVSSSFTITVNPAPVAPLALNFTASPEQILTTGTTTLSATVSGGTAPYSYVFVGQGSISQNGNTATVSGLIAGVQTFTVTVTDATAPNSQTISGTVSVTVNQANQAPTTTGIASQTTAVNQPFNLNIASAFSDPENQTLSFSATGLPADLMLVNGVISGTPLAASVSQITVTATDPGNLTTSATFTLTVNPAPATALTVVASASPVSLLTTGTTTLSATVSGGTAPYSYSFSGPGTLTQTGNTATVSGLTAGVQTFTITATDATTPTSQTLSGTVSVTVSEPTPVNTAPTTTGIANQTATATQPFTLTVVSAFSDAETPDALTLMAIGLPTGLALSNGVISGTPSTTGVSQVMVTASDPGSLSISATFTLTVNAPASTTTSAPFAITGVATASCEPITAGLRQVTFTPQYAGLTGQPVSFSVANEMRATTQAGPYALNLYTDNPTVTLQAVQGGVQSSFTYNWLAACGSTTPTNQAPTVVNQINNQTATVNQPFSFMIPANTFADDTGSASLSLSINGLPNGLGFNSDSKTVSGIPTNVGSSSITVTATDAGNLSVSTSFVLTVNEPTSTTSTTPFAITGVRMLSCETVRSDLRKVSFTPQYAGLSGQSISFSVVNEMPATTQAGPYMLNLYTDNPSITLQAVQGGVQIRFTYNWLATCGMTTPVNQAPTVVSPIANQTATVNQSLSFIIPVNTFADDAGVAGLSLSVSGLSTGLTYNAGSKTITGTPNSVTAVTVTVRATDMGNLFAETNFTLSVNEPISTTNTTPFAITGVTTARCEPITAGLRKVTFAPQYAGLSGQPVSFSVVNEMQATTQAGPYALNLYTDNPTVTLQAVQGGVQSSFTYNWLAACGAPNARRAAEQQTPLMVTVLGNPTTDETVTVEVRGTDGQSLKLRVIDLQGHTIDEKTVEQPASVEQHQVRLGRTSGIYLLQVNTLTKSKTVKVVRQ